jgi:uncharacterized membrane protein
VHEFGFFSLGNGYNLMIGYPILPWIGVMSLGYYFGSFYDASFHHSQRKRIFNIIGICAVILFIVIRFINKYGDPNHWKQYDTMGKELMSFLNPSKYPPSLLYLLMTLGGTFLFLANTEKLRGRLIGFFCTFGRVPFFYYILHLYLIHILAMAAAEYSGYGWQAMILPFWVTEVPALEDYGFGLLVVYAVWICVVAMLYPLCKKFDAYKRSHTEKWWLSYL